jgi:uncharacterized protein (UPF0332 family)
MSLKNLLEIGSLDEAKPQREDIQRLLAAAERNLNDAGVTDISDENRFDAAYKCVMQCALASLLAHGYRPAMSKPGHHQTAIQSLPTTIGLDKETMVELDELRKLRNCDDYEGEPVSPDEVEDAQGHAKALLARVRTWLGEHHPELLSA